MSDSEKPDARENDQHPATEGENAERPQYHHDPDHGETRYPPETGAQHPGRAGHSEPHSALNTPVSAIDSRDEIDRAGLRESGSEANRQPAPEDDTDNS